MKLLCHKAQKNRMSSRQPISNTNYLKTNLLKQIKNIVYSIDFVCSHFISVQSYQKT